MRDRDFNVFFSEDEAPPGEQLDKTLRSALLHSHALVVIANRATLHAPRSLSEPALSTVFLDAARIASERVEAVYTSSRLLVRMRSADCWFE
jgi:hypothetical protein